jgi:Uma2 family endonuclease
VARPARSSPRPTRPARWPDRARLAPIGAAAEIRSRDTVFVVVAPRHHHHFDFADYLRVEEDSGIKHEFADGQVWAMSGGSPGHARIIANVSTLLNIALGARRSDVFSSELRIRVLAVNRATYPDVSVICDHVELDPEDPKGHTALNPTLLVEVLSPSTAEYDQGEKLAYYKQIPSLQEIMLVHHDARRVVVWRRTGESWSSSEHTDAVELRSLECKLAISDIYRERLA